MKRCLPVFVAAALLALVSAARARPGADAAAPGDAPSGSPFVGAKACAPCHQQIHDRWTGGRHSKMIQPATSASVQGDFARASVSLRGSRYGLRVANGDYFITESFLTGKEQEHRVEYTLGSRRIQHYLTTIDKGRIIVLPPSWDVERREWFHNMDIVRPDQSQPTPVQHWNKDCVGCHVSQQEKDYRTATGEYATRWVDFGTSCERCHGPGRAHVDRYTQDARTRPVEQRLIVKPTRLDPGASSMVCAQCHSLRNTINLGYTAGADYYDFFTPMLEYDSPAGRELPYWPDGRPRRFSNDAFGLWQSACFLKGGATCTDCHRDPHEPDIDRNPQLAPGHNALCTRCHAEIGARLTAHSHHPAGSAGTSCVECHMPKTVISIKATMRDHTIGVPAPENTVAYGIPNACTDCHANRKPAWAVEAVNRWWPGGRGRKLVFRADTFTAARGTRPGALDGLLTIAADTTAPPLIRATAVGYLRHYSDARARAALIASLGVDHPAVRVAASASLGQQVAGQDAATRSALLGALADSRRAVRIAALVSLINAGGDPIGAADLEQFRRVGEEFATLSPLYQDDAGFDRDLGLVHLLSGDFDRAAAALELVLGLEPSRPSARFLFALARLGQWRVDEARRLLADVPRSDPAYSAAQRRLKQLAR